MGVLNFKDIVSRLINLCIKLDYPVNPGFKEHIGEYDFRRKIGKEQHDFWGQYNDFISLMDGFSIDGFSVYGIRSYRDENNSLFEFNDEQAIIEEHAEGLTVEKMETLIVIGTTGTDIFVYDVNTHNWEARDRVAIAETYESCGSLADFLEGVVSRIEEANA